MPSVKSCEADCANNLNGECQCEEITISDGYDCEQFIEEELEDEDEE